MTSLKTLAFFIFALLTVNATAQTRTFYFLPPSDDKWIAGNSYLYDGEKVELMD